MEIRLITAGDTYPVRAAVLRPGRPREELIFAGDEKADAVHFGAYMDGQLAGIATIFPQPLEGLANDSSWQLRGMAVLPEFQGRGIGKALLRACVGHVEGAGGTLVWCNARASAVLFYRANGFQVVGESFDVPGIGAHFRMIFCVVGGG